MRPVHVSLSRPASLETSPLDQLFAEIRTARTAVADERHVPRATSEWTPARDALLAALENCASSLAAAGRSMPYRLRDELIIYRLLADGTLPIRSRSS